MNTIDWYRNKNYILSKSFCTKTKTKSFEKLPNTDYF